jgi:hypothetical protein
LAKFSVSRLTARLAAAAAGLPIILIACTAQVRVAGPVYVPPPPVAVAVVTPGVVVRAEEAPPALPDYDQPPCPADGYLWTPGYWAWGDAGYYWVPGTWVQPPRVGLLWTPGYWGFAGGVYVFHGGYWGPHVGFYGGVHYGFGYVGVGYAGGRWVGNSFAYNRSVTNISNTTVIHNTYNETVVNDVTVNRVSYNGGAGGVAAMPTAQERMAARESHVAPTPLQQQHVQQAAHTPELSARANGGHPSIAATARPAEFHAQGVVAARGAPEKVSERQPQRPASAGAAAAAGQRHQTRVAKNAKPHSQHRANGTKANKNKARKKNPQDR